MAQFSYTGTVVFPSNPTPIEGEWGARHNILIALDQQPPEGARHNNGQVRIYKKVGSTDANYMLTLEKDNKVQLTWNEAGDKSYWTFVIPAGWTPQSGGSQPAQPARQSGLKVPQASPPPTYKVAPWKPMSPGERAAFKGIMVESMDMLEFGIRAWAERLQVLSDELGVEFKLEDATNIPISAYIQAQRSWRPGVTAGEEAFEQALPSGENDPDGSDDEEPDNEADDQVEVMSPPLIIENLSQVFDDLSETMVGVKAPQRVNKLIEFIISNSDNLGDAKTVKEYLRDEVSMGSKDITADPASWRRFVHAALMVDEAINEAGEAGEEEILATFLQAINIWFHQAANDGGVPF